MPKSEIMISDCDKIVKDYFHTYNTSNKRPVPKDWVEFSYFLECIELLNPDDNLTMIVGDTAWQL